MEYSTACAVCLCRVVRSREASLFCVVCVKWEVFSISSKDKGPQINEEIRDKEVRLISAAGEQLGIM